MDVIENLRIICGIFMFLPSGMPQGAMCYIHDVHKERRGLKNYTILQTKRLRDKGEGGKNYGNYVYIICKWLLRAMTADIFHFFSSNSV